MAYQRGVTLFEMLFALVVLSILATLALPDFKTLADNRKAKMTLESLAGAISLARTRAIMSGITVTICPSSQGQHCERDWLEGSLVFADRNADRVVNEDDEVLLVQQHDQQLGSISWRSFQNRQYLQINSRGFTRNQNGSFTYCNADKDPEHAQQLVINRLGRTLFAIDSDGDGVRENWQGKPLSCS